MLERQDVDIVIVCHAQRRPHGAAVAAAEAGKHVVVEKPLEITVERCDRIIDACDRNGVKLCTIFPSRFADANRALKSAVDAGRFGRLTLGETTCKWWRSAGILRRGRLARAPGARRRRRPDEPGHPQRRSTALDDGTGHRSRRRSPPRWPTSASRWKTPQSPACASPTAPWASSQATTSIHPGLPKTIAVHGDPGTAVIEQEDVLRWDFVPETDEDRAVKERFAQKVGASGGASSPVGHLARLPRPPANRFRPGTGEWPAAARRWPRG